MLYKVISVARARSSIFLGLFALCLFSARAETNTRVRIMSANITSGTGQSYETAGIDIFQGLKPDIVAIQEFRFNSSSSSNDLRLLVNAAFGTNYYFYCEPGYNIPNGIVSRWPITNAGSWDDSFVNDRGFAWAQISLPGTNDLYVVSAHLYGSGTATDRGDEAATIKSLIQSNFPSNAWVIVGGDFNTSSRGEAAVTTFKTFLSDFPIPNDNSPTNLDEDTNEPRNKPYDFVLPSFSFTNFLTPVVLPSHTLNNGLVFDSSVYQPLSDVAPVAFGDSHVSGMQHMAVIKDFLIGLSGGAATNPPSISAQPQSLTVPAGSNTTFAVTASGAAPLSYQWYFNTNTFITGANASTYAAANAQSTNSGAYSVIITNAFGSATSAVAILTVTNVPPSISSQPQNQTVNIGANPAFSVTATGTSPLAYQWLFNTTNFIVGATTNSYTVNNAQLTNAGGYSVIITNSVGSVTSAVATLTLISSAPSVVAQWNFNSVNPDANNATGTSSPSIGSGTAALVGTTATFATGDTSLDPAGSTDNSGWNTATYPSQSAGNKTRGVQFSVSTVGRQNIVIAWTSQSSNTGSKYGRLQYSTNGTDFADFANAFTNGTSFTAKTNSLASIPGVNDNANFAIRLVSEFESSVITNANNNYLPADPSKIYGTTGTMRYDMFTVLGSALVATNPPASPAVLSSPAIVSGNQFQLTVTGTPGSNYVIQLSTNVSLSNWISIYTNASPFTFTNSSANSSPQGFFRALAAP